MMGPCWTLNPDSVINKEKEIADQLATKIAEEQAKAKENETKL